MKTAFILMLTVGLARADTVTILRDEWGVPRISGDSKAAVAFGFGYAQAEDRLEQVLKGYLAASGRMASVFGRVWLEEDCRQIVLRHAEVSRARYGDLSPETRAIIEAFVAGIARWMDEHPAKVPAWATKPEPWQPVALVRHAAWAWPVGQAYEDMGRAVERLPGAGSNEWAVSPARSAEGCAIACIDPHVGITGTLRWYEAHLHGGGLDAYGFALAGTHVIALGHNDVLSWACTTGGPDTSDAYEEELDEGRGRYRSDGEWLPVESKEIEILVREGDGTRAEKRTVRRTRHGPIAREDGARAIALKLPYEEEVGLADQFLAMNLSRSLVDFRHALESDQFFPQNVMCADVDGNIFYIRTGRVPIRPAGVDPSRPIPGSTARNDWLGLHRQDQMVQCLNPPAGFFQNCNISPDTMLPGSPMTLERYGPVLFNSGKGGTNPRGRRAVEVLEKSDRMMADDAVALCLDTGVWGYRGWLDALKGSIEFVRRPGSGDMSKLDAAWKVLKGWDGRMDAGSAAATLFYSWKTALRKRLPRLDEEVPPPAGSLAGDDATAFVRALVEAASGLEKRFGSIEVPWGRMNRLRRGDRSFPVSGASPKNIGLSTLRAVGTRPLDDGTLEQVSGQTCPTVVLLRPGRVLSFSAIPFGESDDPASSHFLDQAEKLYSPGKLKDTRYRGEASLTKIASKLVLEVPAGLVEAGRPRPPREVTAEEVEAIARLVATPHKLGRPVLEPTRRKGDFDADAVDCPNVFRFRGRWYMTYIGHDGTGYRTGLATSDDLLQQWKRQGIILDRGRPGSWDEHGAAGLSILGEDELFGGHEPYKVGGRYWMSYYGNDEPGYEAGYGSIGLAWSEDLRSWHRFEGNPILSPREGGAWEKGTLYKSFLFRPPGGGFALLYNAKDSVGGPWKESTGLATSPDLFTWTRCPSNPVLPHGPDGAWDSAFASDPVVYRHGDLFVLFHFGFDGKNAREGLAASRDLVKWTKRPRPIIDIGPPGSFDGQHAHKPSIVWHDGVFYHFYCSVRDGDGYRTITLAASRRWWGGKGF